MIRKKLVFACIVMETTVFIVNATNNALRKGLNGHVYDFSVDYNIIDNSNIVNIHKYLMKKHDIK